MRRRIPLIAAVALAGLALMVIFFASDLHWGAGPVAALPQKNVVTTWSEIHYARRDGMPETPERVDAPADEKLEPPANLPKRFAEEPLFSAIPAAVDFPADGASAIFTADCSEYPCIFVTAPAPVNLLAESMNPYREDFAFSAAQTRTVNGVPVPSRFAVCVFPANEPPQRRALIERRFKKRVDAELARIDQRNP